MSIDSNERDAMHGYHNVVFTTTDKGNSGSTTALNIVKVFLYVFAFLAVTTVVAMAVGAAVFYGCHGDTYAINNILSTIGIISSIVLLIDVIVMSFTSLKGKGGIVGPAIFYAVLVGLMFSSLTIFVDWRILGMAFGITSAMFAVMGLIAFLTKGNMSLLLVAAIALLIGAGFIALFNFIFLLFNPVAAAWMYWVVTFAMFAFFMLVTIYDLWNLKKIAEKGEMSKDLTLYCAFSLYVDFINILLRIIWFLILIFGRRR